MSDRLRSGGVRGKPAPTESPSPATRTATQQQRNIAIAICGSLVVITMMLFPFALTRWPVIPAFLPMYQTAIIGSYVITAYLMYGHYKANGSEALLHLSAGCLYTSCVLILQFLSFPGAFIAGTSLVGGTQTTIWLWFCWHAGPAFTILFYAWSEVRRPGYITIDHKRSVQNTAVVLAIALVSTTVLATVCSRVLPVLDVNGDFSRITSFGIAPGLEVLLALSLALLWRASRFRNVLHLWLGISLVALLCDNAITMAGASRLSLGWYVGRFSALISSSVMLLVYLQEIKQSYQSSVATANILASSYAELSVAADAARSDGLTKLPGRGLFMELAESKRVESVAASAGFATLFIDLDGFKGINDRHGHDYGDWVLVRVAAALKSVLREDDIVGRYGGDEFVACLSGPAEFTVSIAKQLSERVVDAIAKISDGIGASIGISICTEDVETALNQADKAMYDAKKLGKNRFNLYRQRPVLLDAA